MLLVVISLSLSRAYRKKICVSYTQFILKKLTCQLSQWFALGRWSQRGLWSSDFAEGNKGYLPVSNACHFSYIYFYSFIFNLESDN